MKTEQILLKLQYLIAAILLPFAFIACSDVDDYATANDLPIHLGTGEVTQTKAASIGAQLPEGQKIGVYFSEDVTGTPSITYESNLLYTSDGEGALSGKMQYFPTGNGIKISAYHPYNEDLADEYTFTVSSDQTSDANVYASDLLYCPEFSQARTTEMIKLTFGHKLSQFIYELSSGAGAPDLTDAQVTLLGVQTSVTFNRTTGTVSDASNPQDVELNDEGKGGIIVPQTIAAGTRLVKIVLKDGSEMFYTTESNITFEPNKSFKLKLRVNKNEAIGIGTEVGEWQDGGEGTGEANEDNADKVIKVTTVVGAISFNMSKNGEENPLKVTFMIALIGSETMSINWGDGTIDEITKDQISDSYSHTYAQAGTYNIEFSSEFVTQFEIGQSSNFEIKDLNFGSCPNLKSIFLFSTSATTFVMTNSCPKVESICILNGENLTTMDLTASKELKSLDIYNIPKLNTLDVSKNEQLTFIHISGSGISNLDLSKNPRITQLECMGNNLATLDVSKNTELKRMDCMSNNLSTITGCDKTQLRHLDCSDNNMNAGALNTLFISLPPFQDVQPGNPDYTANIYIKGNPGEETCDDSVLAAKYWKVRTY